jgi:hypothetical protein
MNRKQKLEFAKEQFEKTIGMKDRSIQIAVNMNFDLDKRIFYATRIDVMGILICSCGYQVDIDNIDWMKFIESCELKFNPLKKKKPYEIQDLAVGEAAMNLKDDLIKRPKHYGIVKDNVYIDPIMLAQELEMSFDVGSVLKYIWRAGKKDGETEIKDLKKAAEFLDRRVKFLESK